MKQMNKQFDCVEYQRAIRLKNYEEAGGDYRLMLLNREKRLNGNELWIKLVDKTKDNKPKVNNSMTINEPETNYNA